MTGVWLRCGLVGLLLLLAASPGAGADAVELRWRFQKGQVLKYLFKHREVRKVALADQKLETTTTSEYEWNWTVQALDDRGTATLEQKLTALRVSSTGKEFDFQYDSAQGNQSNDDYKTKLINFYDQLRFATCQVQLERTGRVVKVTGFDKLLGEVNPGRQVVDFHALALHDDTFAWYLQQALGTVPAKPVATGQKWEMAVETKLTDMGALTGRNQYSLTGPVKVGDVDCQEVRVQGAQTLELDMTWLDNPLRGALKIPKIAGGIRIDPKAGRVWSSEVQIDMDGDLKFGRNDPPAALKVEYEHKLELEARP
jgi:hypothetical protein